VEKLDLLSQPTVLIMDDDPSHLKLYAWIAETPGLAGVDHSSKKLIPRSEKRRFGRLDPDGLPFEQLVDGRGRCS
jgi:hypothetical protein